MGTETFDKTIALIRDVLAEEFKPQSIFLFGSRAWGVSEPQSDIDICVVVKESSDSKAERIRQGLRALLPYRLNLDLLVFTEEEFLPRSKYPASLAYQIVNKGKKIYEAA